MELIKAVDAYMALGILAKEPLPFTDSLKIAAHRKKFKPLYDFFAEEEKKIVCEVSKKDEKGRPVQHADGHFEFVDESAKQIYKEKMSELSKFDVGNIEVIYISPPSRITAEALETLNGFVEFKEEEKNESPA